MPDGMQINGVDTVAANAGAKPKRKASRKAAPRLLSGAEMTALWEAYERSGAAFRQIAGREFEQPAAFQQAQDKWFADMERIVSARTIEPAGICAKLRVFAELTGVDFDRDDHDLGDKIVVGLIEDLAAARKAEGALQPGGGTATPADRN